MTYALEMTRPQELDLSARTCIVTGANSGIGKEVARGLARYGAEVILACRNLERGRAALEELQQDTGSSRLHLMQVDLSIQGDVRRFAQDLLERFPAIHVLVNNAGIYLSERRLTEDGIEETWATNVMAYYLLTDLLLPRLRACAPSRIVNVASTRAGNLDEEDLSFERRPFWGVRAYEQSKQANRMLSWVRAEALADSGVTVNVAHPGPVATGIARHQTGIWGPIIRTGFRVFGRTPKQGADTALWLASSPELEGASGKFYGKRRELPRSFYDPTRQKALAQRCAELIQVSAPPQGQ